VRWDNFVVFCVVWLGILSQSYTNRLTTVTDDSQYKSHHLRSVSRHSPYLLSNVNFVFDAKYVNEQQIHFSIHYVFYSQLSHQHVSAGIPAIFRVVLLHE
jgi:hypothetical protein